MSKVIVFALGIVVTVATAEQHSVDLIQAAAKLANMQEGGILDISGRYHGSTQAVLAGKVQDFARAGKPLWVLILPEESDLKRALEVVGGRISPGQDEMIVVASSRGLRARVPGLAGHRSLIDKAFNESKRDLAADLPSGIAAFVSRLETAQSRLAWTRKLTLAVSCVLVAVLSLYLLYRYRFYWGMKKKWTRADEASHAKLVNECQRKLQQLSRPGALPDDPGYFDEAYARFKELAEQSPLDARAGLTKLFEELEERLKPYPSDPQGDTS